MNPKTPNTQAPQSSVNAMRPLGDQELDAIVGGWKIKVTFTVEVSG